MSFNLVDLIKNELGDVILDQVTNLLGESKENTGNALNGAVSGILENLVTSSSKAGGADNLVNTLGSMDENLLGNFASMLGGDNHSSLIETGGKLLGSLLGGGAISKIATSIARFSGIKSQSASSLIGLIAPVILGVIRKKMSSDNLDANGLLSMLQGQKDNIAQAAPAGMQNLIDPETTERPRMESSRGPRWGKLLWIPLFLLAGLFAYFYLPKLLPPDSKLDAITPPEGTASSVQERATNIENSAIDAATDSSGYVNIGGDLGNVINNVTDTLTTVTDAESATTALPRLTEASSKLGALSELFNKLPGPAKSAISNIAANKITSLQPVIDRILQIPGVGTILKPALDSLTQKLTEFSAA